MKVKTIRTCIQIAALLAAIGFNDGAQAGIFSSVNTAAAAPQSDTKIEVAFSPGGGANALVIRALNSARSSIRLAAYTFTSPEVVRALIAAKRRGVDVAVVADYRNNVSEDRSGKARAALNLLVNAGIPTRTIATFPIHHDKYAVIDGRQVQTGSFNYTVAAATKNSENVLVLWNAPDIARQYLAHWQSRYEQGQDYRSAY